MKNKPYVIAPLLFLQGGLSVFGAAEPGTQLWVYDTGRTIMSSPALAPDGTIYIGGSGTLYAITNWGSNRWTFATVAYTDSSPAVGGDGTIYYSSIQSAASSGYLYAVNNSGSQDWAYPGQTGNGSAALAPDGTVYINGNLFLLAVSPAPTLIWKYRTGDWPLFASPVAGGDGTIYTASRSYNLLYAISSDGTVKWDFTTYETPADSAAIGADGTIYFTGGWLYAFTPNGTNLWINQTNDFAASSPVIGADGTIYVVNHTLALCAINSAGVLKWRAVTNLYGGVSLPWTPAIDTKGTVYYPALNKLYAVTPSGAIQWVFTNADGSFAGGSPAIGPDGTIYAPFGTKLYAIAGTNRLGDTPWPMFRQNLRHTGKAERPTLKQPQKRSDGGFQFQLQGELGQGYTVLGSTNLNSWTSLTNFVATTVPMDVVDFTATNFPVRFYRASSP
jgi:hypothetical protein